MARKKTVILGSATVIVLLGLVAAWLLLRKDREPFAGNLLVITLDTTRADSLGIYGGIGNHTPNLDRLAREGVMFRNCLTPVPITLPAHCSLFTGRSPLAHQVRKNGRYALGSEEVTLAERLKPNGFLSYAVVASYVLLGRFGLKQGFDEYDDSLDTYKIMNSYNTEIPAGAVSARFRSWLSKHKNDRFFAWVHFYDPHEPYAPPGQYRKALDKDDLKSLYLGEVEFMDHEIGEILKELETLGLLSRTLIVAAGDHGEAFAEHVEKGHTIFCYEENIKVPLIFFHQTLLPRNIVIEDRISLIDVLPTILELYGLERGEEIEGRSLVPLFQKGKNTRPGRPLYIESLYGFEDMGWAPLTGIVDGDFKYVSLPRPELYDLSQDKAEKNNLNEVRPDVASRLKKLLTSYISIHTEVKPETKRELTAEDISQLRSLGYIASSSGRPISDMDPKDGIALNAKLDDFFESLAAKPAGDIDRLVDLFLQENKMEKSPSVYARLWRLYRKRNNLDKVIQTLQEAAAAFPGETGWLMQLAGAYSINKKYDQVISTGREILEREPGNSVAHILIGDAYTALGDSGAAQASLEKALETEPENISLLIKYSELLISRQKLAEALRIYDRLIKNEDVLRDHEFLFKLALFYSRNGNDGRAAELLSRCCDLKPSGKYYFYRAVILTRLEDIAAARENMRIALERYGDELTPEQRAQAEKLF